MNKLLSMQQVTESTCLSACSIYRMVKDGSFPQPLKLRGRMVAWVEAEVSDWIDRRIELGKAEYVADEATRERMADVRLGKQHNAGIHRAAEGRPVE